jgi:general nucleoside transport system permease protein
MSEKKILKRPDWYLKIRQKIDTPSGTSITASVISIALGLIFGLILLFFIDAYSAFNGFANLLFTGFSSKAYIAKMLYKAAPLIMTGLSVGFAFKAGLFNIGATGQYTFGAFAALYFALILKFPWYGAMLVAMIAGALWGAIPGIFKALFNVNEVITSIMFNWIALFLVNLMYFNIPGMWYSSVDKSRTAELSQVNASAVLPDLGLKTLFSSTYINIGIIVAIIAAIVIYIVLEKTTFGYELKACGSNRNTSIYAGINAKRNIILSMVIAGALSGIGGAISYLAGTVPFTIAASTLLPMGFNGIPVALLAYSAPLGVIVSGVFIAYLQVGGEAMQPEFSTEMVNIILSVIIYFSAFSLIMRQFISKTIANKKAAELTLATPAPIPPDIEKAKKEGDL